MRRFSVDFAKQRPLIVAIIVFIHTYTTGGLLRVGIIVWAPIAKIELSADIGIASPLLSSAASPSISCPRFTH